MELDYRNEAKHTQRFREIFHSDATVYIPRIYHAYTTRRILVYERIVGITPDCAQSLTDAQLNPRTVATNGANAMMKMMFEHGFFHADPHPGKAVVADPTKHFLHALAGALFQRFAQEVHAHDEHAHTGQQPDQALDQLHNFVYCHNTS